MMERIVAASSILFGRCAVSDQESLITNQWIPFKACGVVKMRCIRSPVMPAAVKNVSK